MGRFDFDALVERRGTDSLKFDTAESRGHSSDLLSLWVADMDFRLPAEILDTISDRVQHGVFGYTVPGSAYYDAAIAWIEGQHGWRAEREWFALTPGVVFALATAVRAFTEPGDAVLIQRPVYYPFSGVVESNGRVVANVPLVYEEGAYRVDFEEFERVARGSGAKLFLLCNPHNPVGRAWCLDELERMVRIALDLGMVVVSDEIHMDFARPGHRHVSVAHLGEDVLQHVAICTSGGKTFNLAGLQASNIIIPNPSLRRRFIRAMSATGFGRPNALGLLATQTCFERGLPWLLELKDYLEGNWMLVKEHLEARAPKLRLIEAESTYLAWVDCRAYDLRGSELERFVEDQAGLWLDCGDMFGPEGDGFIRINIATQRAYLERALTQLTDAFAALG